MGARLWLRQVQGRREESPSPRQAGPCTALRPVNPRANNETLRVTPLFAAETWESVDQHSIARIYNETIATV